MIKKVFFLTAVSLLTHYSYTGEDIVSTKPARLVLYSRNGKPDEIALQREEQQRFEEWWELYNKITQAWNEVNWNERQSTLITEERVRKECLRQLLSAKKQCYNLLGSAEAGIERLKNGGYFGYKECDDEKSYKLACRSIDLADDVITKFLTEEYLPAPKDNLGYYKRFFDRKLFVNDERVDLAVPLLDKRLGNLRFGNLRLHSFDYRLVQARLALAFVVIGRGHSLFKLLKNHSSRFDLGALTPGKGLEQEITDLIRVVTQTNWYCPRRDSESDNLSYLENNLKKYFPHVPYRQPTQEELSNLEKELKEQV